MSVLRDLAEPLALFFLLGAVYYCMAERFWVASVFLSLGALTKELGVVVAVAMFGWCVWGRKEKRVRCVSCFLLPMFLFSLWYSYIWSKLGVVPYARGRMNLGLPFNSVGFILEYLFYGRSEATRVVMASFFASFLLSIIFGVRLLRKGLSFSLILLLVFLGISALFTPLIWGAIWSYPRVFLYVYALLFVVYFEYREKLFLLPIVGMTLLPLLPFLILRL